MKKMKKMKKIEGGVTAPEGFAAAGVHAGIKKVNNDMAMIVSEVPAKAAGTFTTNVVKASPVRWNQKIIESSSDVWAIIINSGVANACTGVQGDENNEKMASLTAEELEKEAAGVLTASTGVIGSQLPMDAVENGIHLLVPALQDTLHAGTTAAKSIMTTDTYEKEYAVEFQVGGKKAVIGGMAKGSGMIHPNMATMLGFLTTDVNISKELLQEALREDIKDSFNMISVDGDTSTNDMVLCMANAMAGNQEITTKNEDYEIFCMALNQVTTHLAKKMAADGEGASKLLEVQVTGASSKEQAVILSKSIITSSLVKTAVFGNDANWGRILCAMGYSGVQFDPEKVDLFIESRAGKLQLVENGMAAGYSEEKATEILSEKEVTAIADIKQGNEKATAWGCDLTYDYVKINADYRS